MGESPRMEPTDAAARPFATMPPAMGMFRSLQGFNYRTWAVGALVSNVGTRMQRTAQDWLVLTQLTHNNGTAVGVVMALQFGPQVLLLPWTGYAADRFDGRKFLFVTQAALGTLALGLGALTLTGLVQMWHVYVFAFLLGCVTAFDTPARQAFVSELVADHDLPNAVGLNSTSFNVARFIGPAIAGVLIIAVGTGWVFLLNAASFVAVLVSLSLLRVTELRRRHGAERARGSFTEGFRFVWNRPDLRTILIMVFFVNIVGQSFPIFISTMAVSVFHKGAGQFGLLTSIMAIGCMSGALLAARRTNPRIPVLVAAAALFGLGMAIAAVMPYYSLFGIALAVVGISTQTFDSTSNSVLQLSSEPVMRGRVLAISVAIAVGGSPIGAPLIGWVADTFGPRWAIGVGAAAGIAAAFIGLRHLAKHR